MTDRQPPLTPMPDGYYWAPRCHLDKLPTGLHYEGEVIVSMLDRVGGGWIALFHLLCPMPKPPVTRRCTSFDNGRRGAEEWCRRHHDEVVAHVASRERWIRENVAQRGRVELPAER